MKGQFMVVSAVIGGLILISVGTVVSDIQTQTFEPEDTQHQLSYIEREADKIYRSGKPNTIERENFRSIVNELDYSNTVSFGTNHVNVTLRSPSETYRLEKLGD